MLLAGFALIGVAFRKKENRVPVMTNEHNIIILNGPKCLSLYKNSKVITIPIILCRFLYNPCV